MNILIVCGEYFNNSNGLSLSTQRFVREFRKQGENVRVLAMDRGGQPDYAVSMMKVPFVDGIMDRQNYHFAGLDAKVVSQALEWAEIVHFEDPFPLSVQTAKMASRRHLPITGTFHLYPENMTASVPIFDFKLSNRNILNVFRWGVFQYCYAIQCPTEKVKRRLEKCGYKSKLYVISNGIPSEFIADRYPEKHNTLFTVISTGRYSNEKDQTTLMRAIAASKHARQIQLILAGRGPLEEEYKKIGETLPNPPIMRFYEQDQLRAAVSDADLYVHCANVEIEGMGCMEAFARGTVPVIADSALSSTSVYALTEENRYEAGNVEELSRKIDYWFENRDRLPEMGQRYIELARSLSVERSALRVLDMMREAVEAAKAGV